MLGGYLHDPENPHAIQTAAGFCPDAPGVENVGDLLEALSGIPHAAHKRQGVLLVLVGRKLVPVPLVAVWRESAYHVALFLLGEADKGGLCALPNDAALHFGQGRPQG